MVHKFDRIWKMKLPTSFSANLWQFGNKMSFYFEVLYFCVVKVLKNWKYQQMLKILIRNMFWDQNIAFSTQKIVFVKIGQKTQPPPRVFYKWRFLGYLLIKGCCQGPMVAGAKQKIFFSESSHIIYSPNKRVCENISYSWIHFKELIANAKVPNRNNWSQMISIKKF